VPRAGLTPGRVIAEAAAVADEVGLDKLTLAAVAERCGVSLPSLYKHVHGLDEVRRGISLLAVRELTSTLARAGTGVTGPKSLHALSAAYRDYARAHPGRYAASIVAPAPGDQEHADVGADAVAVIAAALQGYGLDGSSLIHAIRMWRAACHGLVSLEGAGGFGLPESVDRTYGHLIDALDAAFRNLPAADQSPVAGESGPDPGIG
jgi:AcrR family transcriptional regulator